MVPNNQKLCRGNLEHLNLVIDRDPNWLSLEFKSSEVWIPTVGTICLLLLEKIFSNGIIGVAVVFGDFDFPVTGVKVQDPESKKQYMIFNPKFQEWIFQPEDLKVHCWKVLGWIIIQLTK